MKNILIVKFSVPALLAHQNNSTLHRSLTQRHIQHKTNNFNRRQLFYLSRRDKKSINKS